MTIDEQTAKSRSAWIQTAFVLAATVPVAALFVWGMWMLNEADGAYVRGRSASFAALIGLLHISFGLIAAAMRASARFLHDADEAENLRQEGRALLLGAGALIAAGCSMILLSLAGPERIVSSAAGLAGALLLNAVAMALVIVRRRGLDELNRAIERDSGYLAFGWFSVGAGTWAMLAHLGFATAPAPLDWLTMIWSFGFASGILAAARKGSFDTPARASHSTS